MMRHARKTYPMELLWMILLVVAVAVAVVLPKPLDVLQGSMCAYLFGIKVARRWES